MRKLYLITLFFILTSFNSIECKSFNNSIKHFNTYEWETLIESIIHVESKGNPNAIDKSKQCVGAMQIKKIVVDDCNEYLKYKGIIKQYSYDDRYNIEKSIEMFKIIQLRYNKNKNIHEAIRIWNGGCGWRKGKHNTQPYYNEVIREFNKRYKKIEAKQNH